MAEFIDSRNELPAIIYYCYKNLPIIKVFKYIDLYDDTVLNSLQIKDLISDIELLKASRDLVGSRKQYLLDEIIKLCNLALEEPHLYLKFYGGWEGDNLVDP